MTATEPDLSFPPENPPKKPRSRVLRTLFFGLLLLGGGFAGMNWLGSRARPPTRNEAGAPVTTVKALLMERRDVPEMLSGYGLARALRRSQVAAEVTSRIVWISPRLESGSRVEEGEELVRLDPQDFERDLERSQRRKSQANSLLQSAVGMLESLDARITATTEEVDAAKRTLERRRELAGDKIISETELDEQLQVVRRLERAQLELDWQRRDAENKKGQAEDELASAIVEASGADVELARCLIAAPYGGEIVSRDAELGASVVRGTVLFTLLDPERVEVEVELGASHYAHVSVGSPASLTGSVDTPPIWSGEVCRVSPEIDESDRTFRALLEVDNHPDQPRVAPGALLLARIEGRTFKGVYVVPRVAFVGNRVFIAEPVEGGDEAIARERRLDVVEWLPSMAVVEKGISPGELVIVTNLEEVAAGIRLRVVTESGGAMGGDDA